MQIRSRLTIQFFLITAALLLLSLLAIYFFSARIQTEQFYSTLRDRANTTADLLIRVEQVDSSLLKLIDLNKKDVLDHENISVYTPDGKEIYTNNDTLHFSDFLPNLDVFLKTVQESGEKQISVGRMDIIGIRYTHKEKQFSVLAGAIDTNRITNLVNLRSVLTIVFIFILLIIGIAGWFFAGRALKPIANIIRQVDAISVTNLSKRIDEGNKRDEIARLTMQFNHLMDRIEKAFNTQRIFVSNASHELRNPLTVITSQLEVALLNKRSGQDYEAILSSVLDDIRRLNEMSHRLLLLARIDSESQQLNEVIRLDELLWETRKDFQKQNPEYVVELAFDALPEEEALLYTRGNRELLRLCFSNLMDNACKFSPDHLVRIHMTSLADGLMVSFSDHGPGIDEADIPHLFDPFFRGKRTSQVKGYGVGLSIVDRIVKAHRAKISIGATPSGTKFTLVFRRAQF